MKIRIVVVLFLSLLLFSFCNNEKKGNLKTINTKSVDDQKEQRAINSYLLAKRKAYEWINNLDFDLDYISNKKLGSKKFLAEYLGAYWKLYKSTDNVNLKREIKEHLQKYYAYTKQRKYHNMRVLDDKLYKKNSMSYLRVMWLLKTLGYDMEYYNKEVLKTMNRMNAHLKSRGSWQKEVFKEYYLAFGYKLPKVLQINTVDNGVIESKLPFEKYDKNKSYIFTHFVFAGFEYGNKTKQNRFDKEDLLYIKTLLPKFTKRYREVKPNIDLLGEFVTCMVYLGETDNEEFNKSYEYIIAHQNSDGSWGAYEKARKKIGDDVDFRAYLHTTLVNLEALVVYNDGNFAGSIKN